MATEHPSPVVSSSTGGSRTITETLTEQNPGTSSSISGQEPPVLRLRLKKPRSAKQVQWTDGTVDNEHMNKKKSKCCCIYVKPREFGESSSESEDECEHCYGHVELKKKSTPKPSPGDDMVDSGGGQCASTVETETEPSNDPSPSGSEPSEPKDSGPNPTD